MKKSKSKKLQNIEKGVIPILRKYVVVRSAIFGSIARGEGTEKSDLDILVEFQGEKSLLDLVSLQFALQDALNMKVDVVTYRSVHPLLKEKILEESIQIL